ncbi:hypothetical protein ACF0H5_014695 [Mactra antiquata]
MHNYSNKRMALLRLKLYLSTVFIVCMINLVDCNKFRKLEHGLSMLKGKLSTLENKVYEDEATLQYEMEQIWRMLNSSNRGFIDILNINETDSVHNNKMETVENVIRKIEERSELLTKGFTAEKTELRKRAQDFESEIAGLRNQHVTALTNFTNMADEFMLELNHTVGDQLKQMNSQLEKNAYDIMQRNADEFAHLKKSLNEQFINFKESIEDLNNKSMMSLQQTVEQMEIKHNDLLYSLSSKANKTFADTEVKIDSELQKVREAQEYTDKKTVQLDDMIKTVKDGFDENAKMFNKIEDLLQYVPIIKCIVKGGVQFENSCYLHPSTQATWHWAVDACSKMGARLAEVNSEAENEILVKINKEARDGTDRVWLGASDLENDGVWKWQTSKQPITFQKWNKGEPNGRMVENCLHFYKVLGTWNDLPCDRNLNYICEFTM